MPVVVAEYEGQEFTEHYLGACMRVDLFFVAVNGTFRAFVVDGENLQRFRAGHPFRHRGPGAFGQTFTATIQLPNWGPWWLVLRNEAETPARLEYEVLPQTGVVVS